jgi:hypothetical protein
MGDSVLMSTQGMRWRRCSLSGDWWLGPGGYATVSDDPPYRWAIYPPISLRYCSHGRYDHSLCDAVISAELALVEIGSLTPEDAQAIDHSDLPRGR